MLSSREQKYAALLRELIVEGQRLSKRETPSSLGYSYIQGEDAQAVHTWLARAENLLENLFGTTASQTRHLRQLIGKGPDHVRNEHQVQAITGLLIGALTDLEGGFLASQEFQIAGEVFDSLLEQAKELHRGGHKDIAAILGRIVLEDALRRLARVEGVSTAQKAAKINDELKSNNRYSQPRWRQIQAWLDIGNAAAHGKFSDYSADDVTAFLDGLGSFLASDLHA